VAFVGFGFGGVAAGAALGGVGIVHLADHVGENGQVMASGFGHEPEHGVHHVLGAVIARRRQAAQLAFGQQRIESLVGGLGGVAQRRRAGLGAIVHLAVNGGGIGIANGHLCLQYGWLVSDREPPGQTGPGPVSP